MAQPTVRSLNTADAATAARALESPNEVRQFEQLAAESGSVRNFLDTPEWTAIRTRIMGGDGTPPTGRLNTIADVARFLRWTADGLTGQPVTDEARKAYLHSAAEIDALGRRLLPRPVSPAAPTASGVGRVAGDLSFGEAMTALKSGRQVTRAGWPAGVYVTVQAGYPGGIAVNANTAAATGLPQGSTAMFRPYLMKQLPPAGDVPPTFVMGWAPDQVDLFADDWRIVGR